MGKGSDDDKSDDNKDNKDDEKAVMNDWVRVGVEIIWKRHTESYVGRDWLSTLI